MYKVKSYFDYKFQGLEGSLISDDFDSIVDFCHDKLMQGNNVVISNMNNGITKTILSDEYCDNFDGDFIYKYDDFERG